MRIYITTVNNENIVKQKINYVITKIIINKRKTYFYYIIIIFFIYYV